MSRSNPENIAVGRKAVFPSKLLSVVEVSNNLQCDYF
jgi:hypothetical protein